MTNAESPQQTAPLTIDQALHLAIAHHQAGRLQDAERLYRAILQTQPSHPDANHNLGVLAVQVKQPAAGLPHLKAALEANPNQGQYRLSYIDALIQTGQTEAARQMLKQGQQRGLQGDAIDALVIRLYKPEHAVPDQPAELDCAIAHREAGRYKEAVQVLQNWLASNQKDASAHALLSQVLSLDKQDELAWEALNAALSINPVLPIVRRNYARLLLKQQKLEEGLQAAQAAYQSEATEPENQLVLAAALIANGQNERASQLVANALQSRPDYAEAYANRALLKLGGNDLAGALSDTQKSLSIKPHLTQLWGMLGSLRYQLKDLPGAIDALEKALCYEPDNIGHLVNLGEFKRQAGAVEAAIVLLEKAAALAPDNANAWVNLGAAFQQAQRILDAKSAYVKALEIAPMQAEVAYNLGTLLQELGRLDDAVASYRRALEIKPDFAEAHSNLGIALQELGRLDDAVAGYRRALEIKPDLAEAYNNLGNALKDFGRLDDAVASYYRALKFKPGYAKAHSNLLFTHNYLSDQPAIVLLAEARRFGDLVERQANAYQEWPNLPDPDRCLRVGLVSGDLRTHPVGYFVESMLAALASHATGRLELIAYPCHFLSDALTERIKASCCGWHSAVGLSDESLARRIRDDRIDILIDLSGHTAHNRLPMFAWKPAPVQVSWLGYFATTGVAAMDYLIADPWTVPPAEEAYFTENIWHLPETYLCFTVPDADVQVGLLPALSNHHITFGCFNNLTKMNDAVVALWARVLQAVPGSRLLLKTKQLGEAAGRATTLQRFAVHGIGVDRLILEGASPRAELLASYHRVDIALDPFPYPGGTTSVESLWMGVPVLTKQGDRFLSHIGETIAHSAELLDWIAVDESDYVAKAVIYASDLDQLARLRGRLRRQVLASPLFDAPRFARHFETALRDMWIQWCAH